MLSGDKKWKRYLRKLSVTSAPQTPQAVPDLITGHLMLVKSLGGVSQSVYAKPPLCIRSPTFGENRDETQVFNFVEQCETLEKLVDGRKG